MGETTALWKQVRLKVKQMAFDVQQLAQGIISKSPLEFLTKGAKSRELIITKETVPNPTDPAAAPVEVTKVHNADTFSRVLDNTLELNKNGEVVFKGAEAEAAKVLAEKAEIIETCFSGDTRVLMEGGKYKQIEDVFVGDKVLSRCEFTGELAYKKVVKKFHHQPEDVSHLTIDGEIPTYVIAYSTTNPEWQDKFVSELEGVLHVSPEEEITLPDFSRMIASKIQRGDRFFNADNKDLLVVRVGRDQDAIRIHWASAWGTLQVTPEHPIWVQGKGWTAVRDIRPDDRFLTSDGSEAIAQKLTNYDTYNVYNLHVEDFHTYFVGSGIWVHNTKITELKSVDQLPVRDTTAKPIDNPYIADQRTLSELKAEYELLKQDPVSNKDAMQTNLGKQGEIIGPETLSQVGIENVRLKNGAGKSNEMGKDLVNKTEADGLYGVGETIEYYTPNGGTLNSVKDGIKEKSRNQASTVMVILTEEGAPSLTVKQIVELLDTTTDQGVNIGAPKGLRTLFVRTQCYVRQSARLMQSDCRVDNEAEIGNAA